MTNKYKSNNSVMLGGYDQPRGTDNPNGGERPCCVQPTPAQQARSRAVADAVIKADDERTRAFMGAPYPMVTPSQVRRVVDDENRRMSKFASDLEEAEYRIWLSSAGG